MKVWLDDVRPAPEGWVRTFWPDEVKVLLETGEVTDVSLDHDLGEDNRGTGYDVLKWVEEKVATERFRPPFMEIHSGNPPARERMLAAVRSIIKLAGGIRRDTSGRQDEQG